MNVYIECFHDDKTTPAWTDTMPVVSFIKKYSAILNECLNDVTWFGDEKLISAWYDPGTGTSMRIEATFK